MPQTLPDAACGGERPLLWWEMEEAMDATHGNVEPLGEPLHYPCLHEGSTVEGNVWKCTRCRAKCQDAPKPT